MSSLVALRFALLATLLAGVTGCATTTKKQAQHSYVYVAPFLDRTPQMRLGLPMTMVVQERLYSRAPDRFLVVFDDAAVAVDGTVLAIDDRAHSKSKRDIHVQARAILVDKRGNVRHDTGIVARAARYELADDAKETQRRRERALIIATSTVGTALADAILTVQISRGP